MNIKVHEYKIIVAYDGTDYSGWQIQPHNLTITQVLQDSFKSVFKKNIKITGASRTDAGVHALGQVAKFELDFKISSDLLLKAWQSSIPKNILIRSVEKLEKINNFHPRANVKQKTYCYYISDKRPLPFFSRYVHFPKKPFSIEKLKEALNVFVGTHDFRSFCTGYEQISTIKIIDNISVYYFKKLNIYQIKIKGQSFLRYMIRRLVGASLDIACSPNRTINELETALTEKNPLQLFTTAPANGLILHKIVYKK